jgi:hypothetical protein
MSLKINLILFIKIIKINKNINNFGLVMFKNNKNKIQYHNNNKNK